MTVADDPGVPFYKAESERPQLLARFAKILADASPSGRDLLQAPDVPWQVGLTPYVAPHRLFVDVNNTSIDLQTDTIAPAPPVQFTTALPTDLRGKQLHAEVLSPAPVPEVELKMLKGGRVAVTLGSVEVYASVLIQPVIQGKPELR